MQPEHARQQLQLYNPLSHNVEPFRPGQPTVTMYVCGIRPYATTHLGHAFTYAAAGVLDIIATAPKLTEAGMAYVAGGSVYFNVDGWPD